VIFKLYKSILDLEAFANFLRNPPR
jgi:hypothetical protein